METQHIKYFLAVCDELNFTRAAKRCGVAQPTVTAAVKRLERQVDGALFERLSHPPYVVLTALGHELYPLCVQIEELLAKAQKIVAVRGRKPARPSMAPPVANRRAQPPGG
jgi:LysR family hydrogen peroxide-inducible transcriptional activator